MYLVKIILFRHPIFRPIFLASVGDYNMAEPNLNREYAPEVPPLDIIEEVVNNQGWHLNRVCEEEMTAVYNGRWCDYSLHFAWSNEIHAINFTCAFDIRVPDKKSSTVNNLLALINDKLWLGHFCIWQKEALPMYRHALPLRGVDNFAPQQVEDLLESAITACEKFYPAFQYVIWGGKNPQQAIVASILEPMGEA